MSRSTFGTRSRAGSTGPRPSVIVFPLDRARHRRVAEGRGEVTADGSARDLESILPRGTVYGDDRSGLFVPDSGEATEGAPGLAARTLVLVVAGAGVGLSLWLGIVRLSELGWVVVTTAGALRLAGLTVGDAPTGWLVGALTASVCGLFLGMSAPAVGRGVLGAATSLAARLAAAPLGRGRPPGRVGPASTGLGVRRGQEPIAAAADRRDEPRPSAVVGQAPAQAADQAIDHVAARNAVDTPERVENLVACDRPAAGGRQQVQQRDLQRRHVDGYAVRPNRSVEDVDLERPRPER